MQTNTQRTLETKSLRHKAAGDDFDLSDVMQAIKSRDEQIEGFAKSAAEKIQGLDDRLRDQEQKSNRRFAGGAAPEIVDGVGQVADSFSKSAQFDAMKNGANGTGRVMVENVSLKAITNTGRGVTGSTDYAGQPQRYPGLFNNPQPRLTLLAALPSIKATAATFEYVRLDGQTNAATYQLKEGDQKAEGDFKAVEEQAQIATIAHFIKASKQVLADVPYLQQQISNLMNYGTLAKLEYELINGAGGKGQIKGLNPMATVFTIVGTPTAVDAIGQAITSLNASGWNANLIVLNPNDWFTISTAKTTTAEYVLGSPRDPSPPSLWGVPVVLSANQPAGKALVLDTAQVAVLDREQPSVLMSGEDGNNFTTNMVTLLAELRAGLAVFASGAVLQVALVAPTK
ncbi:HK97 family phage major capsid protein [Pseudomonas psychrotolerans L19]|uniref:phage major capsid protein n=1 Tax=Pseudomonas oryzihabitans TaxID=47885 RepID=UPI00023A3075|nr:phage major capsid protein [Pseudomonas psychrotolerans]EHK68642.1 HK97 family phage major capsid protein [Pseudomonas psychrotolerans L19]